MVPPPGVKPDLAQSLFGATEFNAFDYHVYEEEQKRYEREQQDQRHAFF